METKVSVAPEDRDTTRESRITQEHIVKTHNLHLGAEEDHHSYDSYELYEACPYITLEALVLGTKEATLKRVAYPQLPWFTGIDVIETPRTVRITDVNPNFYYPAEQEKLKKAYPDAFLPYNASQDWEMAFRIRYLAEHIRRMRPSVIVYLDKSARPVHDALRPLQDITDFQGTALFINPFLWELPATDDYPALTRTEIDAELQKSRWEINQMSERWKAQFRSLTSTQLEQLFQGKDFTHFKKTISALSANDKILVVDEFTDNGYSQLKIMQLLDTLSPAQTHGFSLAVFNRPYFPDEIPFEEADLEEWDDERRENRFKNLTFAPPFQSDRRPGWNWIDPYSYSVNDTLDTNPPFAHGWSHLKPIVAEHLQTLVTDVKSRAEVEFTRRSIYWDAFTEGFRGIAEASDSDLKKIMQDFIQSKHIKRGSVPPTTDAFRLWLQEQYENLQRYSRFITLLRDNPQMASPEEFRQMVKAEKQVAQLQSICYDIAPLSKNFSYSLTNEEKRMWWEKPTPEQRNMLRKKIHEDYKTYAANHPEEPFSWYLTHCGYGFHRMEVLSPYYSLLETMVNPSSLHVRKPRLSEVLENFPNRSDIQQLKKAMRQIGEQARALF